MTTDKTLNWSFYLIKIANLITKDLYIGFFCRTQNKYLCFTNFAIPLDAITDTTEWVLTSRSKAKTMRLQNQSE